MDWQIIDKVKQLMQLLPENVRVEILKWYSDNPKDYPLACKLLKVWGSMPQNEKDYFIRCISSDECWHNAMS